MEFECNIINLGCSKCYKDFCRRDGENIPDYSGFDISSWVLRNGAAHKVSGFQTLSCNTMESRKQKESEHGVRFSQLFHLPYYDPIAMHVVDPMHNLLLGTAKHVFNTWVLKGVLKSKQLMEIDRRQSLLKVPSDVGRISKSISKGYSTMKADEWKHWTLIYSVYCLRDVIGKKHFNTWCAFVNGCRILCKQYISKEEASHAHNLLHFFCGMFEELYGKNECVPNLHMMLHIKECINDYGPVYAFWCFSFERFNGILGRFNTNNHAITIQVMRKFVSGYQLRQDVPSAILSLENDPTDFLPVINLWKFRTKKEIFGRDLEFPCETPLSIMRQVALKIPDQVNIKILFDMIYGNRVVRISLLAQWCKRLRLGNELVASESYRGGTSSYSNVLIRRPEINGNIVIRPAKVVSLYKIQVVLLEDNVEIIKQHFIAEVKWYKTHEYKDFYGINCPLKLWSTEFESYSNFSFVPVKFITGRFVYIKELVDFTSNGPFRLSDEVVMTIPLPTRSVLS